MISSNPPIILKTHTQTRGMGGLVEGRTIGNELLLAFNMSPLFPSICESSGLFDFLIFLIVAHEKVLVDAVEFRRNQSSYVSLVIKGYAANNLLKRVLTKLCWSCVIAHS